MFLTYKKMQILFFLLIVLAISGCGENSPYPIQDAGVNTYDDAIFWLDNDRVIYTGWPKLKKHISSSDWLSEDGIYIWDTRKNKIGTYKKGGTGTICYHDGYIAYGAAMGNKAKQKHREKFGKEAGYPYWEGMMGKETYRSYENNYLGEKRGRNLWRSHISCRLYPVPDQPKGRTLLLDEGEYIDRSGTHNGEGSYVFHNEKKGIRRELPIPTNLIFSTKFYEFSGKYFLGTIFPSEFPESCLGYHQCAPVWWVDREGNIEKILLPLDKNKLPKFRAVPVRVGYFLIRSSPPPLGAGYSVDHEGQMRTALKGWIKNPAVSPDGCKVAFTHFRTIEDLPRGRPGIKLKMIDFCNPE